jgi:poly(A) polymerase
LNDSSPHPPVIIPRSEHPISRTEISPNALKVLYRLKEAGYQGYLVGGAVRDLLLGIRPKDFDVATDALPEEVRRLFRNCRLIGRRFRLAHVHFGNEIIEVATFRAPSAPEREEGEEGEEDNSDGEIEFPADIDTEHRAVNESGRLLRDNIYGSIEADVWRRDFTANALYYSVDDFSLWDFTGGAEDVRARRLNLIGDADERYREDPVRMLRAIRFTAKLDFQMASETEAPIRGLAYLLDGVPPARLFDETLKLFLSGFGLKSYRLLKQYDLFRHLFPSAAAAFDLPPYAYAQQMLELGLANTDARIAEDKPVTPTFLFALLLWGAVLREMNEQQAGPAPDVAQLLSACDRVLKAQQSRVAIPRRFSVPMREVLMLQPRFNRRSGIKSLAMLQHPRFRAAYDFLMLRAQAGAAAPELAEWWTHIQVLPQEERVKLVQARPADTAAGGAEGAAPGAPRRRRRRRRGGRGGGGSGGGDGSGGGAT